MSAQPMKDAAADADVPSPCIGVCTLGPGGLCIGCLRSTVEIGNWLGYSAQERRRIVAALPNRLEQLFSL